MLAAAIPADSVKIGDMAVYFSGEVFCCRFRDMVNAFHVQIHDAAALAADKMVVGRYVGIEVVYAVP